MFPSDKIIENALLKKKSEGTYLKLTTTHNTIDFCSNDFLGFSKSLDLKDRVSKFSRNLDSIASIGASGSRLLSGNTALIESLESFVATYHHAEAGLLFNSAYDATIGLLSSIAHRNDTFIYDEAVHPSVRDGVRLSFAKSYSFTHNDTTSLKNKLRLAKGNIYVIVESVSYLNGDIAPLKAISEICTEANANLIVNESNAVGVFGNGGKGLLAHLNLTSKVFAIVISFGKALGCQGGIVLGSNLLRNYLINFSRHFANTTALPFSTYLAIKSAYDLLNEDEELLSDLHKNITLFRKLLSEASFNKNFEYIDSESPIQCFKMTNTVMLSKALPFLSKSGFDVCAALPPTVSKGKERIKINIHSFNTPDEISAIVKALAQISAWEE